MNRQAEEFAGARTGGFTLIEVVFTMLILAVGLLSLQGLTLGAVRMVARAEQNSQAAVTAAEYLETALSQLRRNPPQAVASATGTLPDGGTWSRTVCFTNSPAFTVHVTVEVALVNHSGPPRPYRLTSYAFSPTPIAGIPAC